MLRTFNSYLHLNMSNNNNSEYNIWYGTDIDDIDAADIKA